MKKIIALLGFMALTTSMSLAYLEEGTTSNLDVLKRQGYSESTLQVVDWTNATNKGEDSTYVRNYTPKERKGLGKAYYRLKTYFDPVQDDSHFAEHQINFSNVWRFDQEAPEYSNTKVEKSGIENL